MVPNPFELEVLLYQDLNLASLGANDLKRLLLALGRDDQREAVCSRVDEVINLRVRKRGNQALGLLVQQRDSVLVDGQHQVPLSSDLTTPGGWQRQ